MMERDLIAEARTLVESLTDYTPRPWMLDADHDIVAGGRVLLSPFWPDIYRDRQGNFSTDADWREAHANARLAAAAPAMRDTIAALLTHIDAQAQGDVVGDLIDLSISRQAQREAEKDRRIAVLTTALRCADLCLEKDGYTPGTRVRLSIRAALAADIAEGKA